MWSPFGIEIVLEQSSKAWVFWEGHKIWKKIFVILLTRASCSVRETALLVKKSKKIFLNIKCGQDLDLSIMFWWIIKQRIFTLLIFTIRSFCFLSVILRTILGYDGSIFSRSKRIFVLFHTITNRKKIMDLGGDAMVGTR